MNEISVLPSPRRGKWLNWQALLDRVPTDGSFLEIAYEELKALLGSAASSPDNLMNTLNTWHPRSMAKQIQLEAHRRRQADKHMFYVRVRQEGSNEHG